MTGSCPFPAMKLQFVPIQFHDIYSVMMVCSLRGGVDEIHMVVQSRWDGVRERTDLLFSGRHM